MKKIISIRLSDETKDKVVKQAKELNMNTSEYITGAIESRLNGIVAASVDGAALAESLGQLNRYIYKNKNNCSKEALEDLSRILNTINENIINIYSKRGSIL